MKEGSKPRARRVTRATRSREPSTTSEPKRTAKGGQEKQSISGQRQKREKEPVGGERARAFLIGARAGNARRNQRERRLQCVERTRQILREHPTRGQSVDFHAVKPFIHRKGGKPRTHQKNYLFISSPTAQTSKRGNAVVTFCTFLRNRTNDPPTRQAETQGGGETT